MSGLPLLAGLALLAAAGNEEEPPRFPLQFESEIVRLSVEAESLRVEGLYVFRCSGSPLPAVSLLFPYPSDDLVGGARTLRLEVRAPGEPWRPLDFRELPQAALWRVPLDLGDRVEIRTVYRQELVARYARYVVTTARAWGVPLRRARFEVRLPEAAVAPRFSLPFERREEGGETFWLYESAPFAPDRDVIVEWDQPDGEP